MNLLDPFLQQQTLAYGLANSQQYDAAQQMAMLNSMNACQGTMGRTPLYRSIDPARQMTDLEAERFNRAGLLRRA